MAVTIAIVAVALGACGSAAPSAAPGSSSPPGGSSAPPASQSGTAPEGIAIVELAEAADPAAAGKRELELAREVRESAGMPALIGKEGEAAFADLDAIEDAFGDKLVAEVAEALDAGQLPTAGPRIPWLVKLASLGASHPAGSCRLMRSTSASSPIPGSPPPRS